MYSNSKLVRQNEHDHIDTAITGGHYDDTSWCSLDIDGRQPNIRIPDHRIMMYYDNQEMYRIRRVSDIDGNDQVFGGPRQSGGVTSVHEEDMIAVYKACARALDQGLFIFNSGTFDCPNKFLQSAGLYDPSKLGLESDRLFPYYFRSNSPIRGEVTFDQTFVERDRRITVVNVQEHGDLSTVIPDRTVIYLGGDHDEKQFDLITQYLHGSIDRKTVFERGSPSEKRCASVCLRMHWHCPSDGGLTEELQISSPFPNTWGARGRFGPNVAVCMSKDERFVYWLTTLQPEDGKAVSRISLTEIPLERLDPKAGFQKEYPCDLEDIFEGAWVMEGNYLATEQFDGELPSGIVERLGGGFFRFPPAKISVFGTKVHSRLKKLVRSLRAMSPVSRAALGFRDTEETGVYDCKLAGVAKLVEVKVDVLAAYIVDIGVAHDIFQGLVGYAGRQFVGPLRISNPTPVGMWMVGRLCDTGTGLLYNGTSRTYHTVRTVGDVCYLGVCLESIPERRKLVLGRKLHGEGKVWGLSETN